MCSVETGSCEANLQSEQAPDHVVKSVDGDGTFCCPECGATLRILGCTAVARRNRITLPDWLPEVSPEAPPVAPLEHHAPNATHEPRQPSAMHAPRSPSVPHPPRPSHSQSALLTPQPQSALQTPIFPSALAQPIRPLVSEPNPEFVDGDEPTKVHTGLKLPDAAFANGVDSADEVDLDTLLESTGTPTPSLGAIGEDGPAPETRAVAQTVTEDRSSSADVQQRAVHLSLPGLPALVAPPFARRPMGDRISRPTPTPLPIPGIFGGPIGVKVPDSPQEGGNLERTSSVSQAAAPTQQAAPPELASSTSSSAFPAAQPTERSNEPIASPSSADAAGPSAPEQASANSDNADRDAAEQIAATNSPTVDPSVSADAVAAATQAQDGDPTSSTPSASIQRADESKHVLSDAPFIRDLEPRRKSATGRLGLWLGLAAVCGGAFLVLRPPARSPSTSVELRAATPIPLPAASVSAQQVESTNTPAPDTSSVPEAVPASVTDRASANQASARDQVSAKDRASANQASAKDQALPKKPASQEMKSAGSETAVAPVKPKAPPEQASAEPAEEGEAEQATFDASEAAGALDSAAAEASSCRQASDPSGVAVVTITFAPSGRVTTATIAGPPFVGTATGSCIAATMRRAKVSPFTGKLVTVRKTVTIQ